MVNPEYEIVTAVNDISFQVGEGEIIGYIGPNGAGKSTTIKMLAGILVPTAGSMRVLGCVPHQQRTEHTRHIGVVFGQRTHLWWDVPVIDSLRLLRDIYKVPEAQYQRNLALFSDLLGLNEFQNVPVRQLSLGQRVRADIAAALLHDPAILFLDEPTIGVDVVSKDRLRTFIKEINAARKVTVLLTTHDMNEIEKMCRRVIIIDHGRLIYDGSIEAIRAQYGSQRVLAVDLPGGGGAFRHADRVFDHPGPGLHRLLDRTLGLQHQYRHAGQFCDPALPGGYVRALVPGLCNLPAAGGLH